ncbi:hypothetical protein FB45DRAFT_1057822 [Roridomyces roridus]|uniref:RNase III domain-containing protein n=1 Tax=Roridomyces roridus TaxID=1738132 RepID=A0AAD7FR04_9AGAR|nr:hypothetical protein FB45DRAFT_1057822 [Roridomyces roridus]
MLDCTYDLQRCLIDFVHRHGHYNPAHPPARTPYSSISVAERERLEIYGDALLKWRLISFLVNEYPAQPPRFISRVAAAMLSNWLFTNIFLKAEGYTSPQGYALDKPIADAFETMTAQYYMEVGPCRAFDAWFLDTFRPLVVETEVFLSRLEVRGRRGSRGSKSRPRQEDVSTLPAKRRWVEAMEEAGSQESHWLRAMMEDDKRNGKGMLADRPWNALDILVSGKENSAPSVEEPYRSKRCWDVPLSKSSRTISPVKPSSGKPVGHLLRDPLEPNLSLENSPMRRLELEPSRECPIIAANSTDDDMDPMARLELAVLRERQADDCATAPTASGDEEAYMDPMERLELDGNEAANSSIVHILEWPVASASETMDSHCRGALPDFEDATIIAEENVCLPCWSACSSPMAISPSSSPAPAILTSLGDYTDDF